MERILYQYDLNLTTWVYLSSLLTMAIFIKFGRIWSMRNLDLALLIALAPGLLMIDHSGDIKYWGYVWLLALSGLLLIRLLFDSRMVRRPLLEPNLSPGGLTFLAFWLLVFLMVNVVTKQPTAGDLEGPRKLDDLLARAEAKAEDKSLVRHGPGYPWFFLLPSITTKAVSPKDPAVSEEQGHYMVHAATARTLAIFSHLAVVIGMVLIGVLAFRQHSHGRGSGHVIFAAALHGADDRPRRARPAGGAGGVGRVLLSPPAGLGHVVGPGHGRDLLPDIFVAVVGWILLAARPVAFPVRLPGHAGVGDGAQFFASAGWSRCSWRN